MEVLEERPQVQACKGCFACRCILVSGAQIAIAGSLRRLGSFAIVSKLAVEDIEEDGCWYDEDERNRNAN